VDERRNIKRTLTSLFIRFTVEDDTSQDFESFTEDMSLEGVKLLTPTPPREFESIEMNIDVPNNPDMTAAEGTVRWVGERALFDDTGREVFPVGVSITYLDRQDKTYLENYLQNTRIV